MNMALSAAALLEISLKLKRLNIRFLANYFKD